MKSGITRRAMFIVAVLVLCFVSLGTRVMAAETNADTLNSQSINAVAEDEMIEIDDEEVPLGVLPKHAGVSWWWLTILIVVGAIGAELICRREIRESKKKKTFESLSDIQRPF